MALSWNEIKERAVKFSKELAEKTKEVETLQTQLGVYKLIHKVE